MFSGSPPGVLVPGPTDTIYGSKAPAAFLRFYQQGDVVHMVDHARRTPPIVARGKPARYGVGRPTPWGSMGVNFTGGEPFQLPPWGPLAGLSILANGASTGFTTWYWAASDPSSALTHRLLYQNGASGGYSMALSHYDNTAPITFNINYGGTNSQGGGNTTAAVIRPWNMVAFVFNNKVGKCYLNGEHFGSDFGGSGTPVAETGNLFIAGDATGGGGCNCAVDHIGIDLRPYSPGELRELYRNPFHMFKRQRVLARSPQFTVAATHNFFF